ncbi:MAG: hypothetical protein AB8B64_14025 [Granulosicoccus sp.]
MIQNVMPDTHWAKMRESGTLFGLKLLYRVHRIFGRGFFTFILLFVSAYFVLTRPEYRRASKDYLHTHSVFFPRHWSKPPDLANTFMHFREFGEAIMDKALAWSTEITEEAFSIVNQQAIDDLLDDERGQLIVGTHLGNLEYCRGFMRDNNNKIINILTYDRHSANFAKAMEAVNPASRLNIYQVDEMDVSMILTLKSRIDEGEWLFIAGDRIPVEGHHRTVNVSFMGRPTALPVGPYQLANTLGCPVKLMFAYRQHKKITVDVIPFADKLTLDRKTRSSQIEQFAQAFANELEKQCESVPYQWFNFYDFWALPEPS